MVKIIPEIQEMMRRQKFIVVGSVDLNGVCNLSPRTSFYYSEDAVYWLDFFKHKSQGNFRNLPWISVAVFDKIKLKGFQMKGKVSFVENESEKRRIIDIIFRSTTGKTSSKIFERVSQNKRPDVLMFKPKALYSLDPEEYSGRTILQDSDGETVSLLGI